MSIKVQNIHLKNQHDNICGYILAKATTVATDFKSFSFLQATLYDQGGAFTTKQGTAELQQIVGRRLNPEASAQKKTNKKTADPNAQKDIEYWDDATRSNELQPLLFPQRRLHRNNFSCSRTAKNRNFYRD